MTDESVQQFVDDLIQNAIQRSASDIHIEPFANQCRIRHRYDGVLFQSQTLSLEFAERVITLFKVLAKLNIAERRLPQDGHLKILDIDIRINTCPTLFGEKMVLRLLNIKNFSLQWQNLGMTDQQKTLFLQKISQPNGLILLTGPTGSGKSRTLYSALHYLNTIHKNIVTAEDPVEIELEGINQVNIHPKIGLDFSQLLRTLLRQDPDILMIGEIRDRETAEIAIHAAFTGHLVLSTIHANNALETIPRLAALGVSSYHLMHAISLVIAQRLLRKLCADCKQLDAAHGFYQPRGCDQCLQGYKNRMPIYEFFPMNQEIIQKMLLGHIDKNTCQQPLYHAAMEKIFSGETSIAEMERVLGRSIT